MIPAVNHIYHILLFMIDMLHCLSLILAYYDNFHFFAVFNPKFDDVIILGFCSYAIPTMPRVITTH